MSWKTKTSHLWCLELWLNQCYNWFPCEFSISAQGGVLGMKAQWFLKETEAQLWLLTGCVFSSLTLQGQGWELCLLEMLLCISFPGISGHRIFAQLCCVLLFSNLKLLIQRKSEQGALGGGGTPSSVFQSRRNWGVRGPAGVLLEPKNGIYVVMHDRVKLLIETLWCYSKGTSSNLFYQCGTITVGPLRGEIRVVNRMGTSSCCLSVKKL